MLMLVQLNLLQKFGDFNTFAKDLNLLEKLFLQLISGALKTTQTRVFWDLSPAGQAEGFKKLNWVDLNWIELLNASLSSRFRDAHFFVVGFLHLLENLNFPFFFWMKSYWKNKIQILLWISPLSQLACLYFQFSSLPPFPSSSPCILIKIWISSPNSKFEI